ncbi:MAG: hypothetical protein QMD77_00025 [Patescibacteria group bacterium]|nr:hypothetical protein [Patescibacteria group bacterium]
MAQRMGRLKHEVEKLRRHSDEVLMAAAKMASVYRDEGKEQEAVQCEKSAEFLQGLDNNFFMATIALPSGQ